MTNEAKRYLVTIQLKADSTPDRLVRDIPLIIDYVRHFSKGDQEQAFRSNDGLLFGFFIKTSAAEFMRPEFEKCRGTMNGDALMVIEAGALAGATGFSRAWTWLQRH